MRPSTLFAYFPLFFFILNLNSFIFISCLLILLFFIPFSLGVCVCILFCFDLAIYRHYQYYSLFYRKIFASEMRFVFGPSLLITSFSLSLSISLSFVLIYFLFVHDQHFFFHSVKQYPFYGGTDIRFLNFEKCHTVNLKMERKMGKRTREKNCVHAANIYFIAFVAFFVLCLFIEIYVNFQMQNRTNV